MKFYRFSQSNPGGFYLTDVPRVLYVQAGSAAAANMIAENSGLVYFEGQASGIDCQCCNDRWYRADEYGAKDKFDFKEVLDFENRWLHSPKGAYLEVLFSDGEMLKRKLEGDRR